MTSRSIAPELYRASSKHFCFSLLLVPALFLTPSLVRVSVVSPPPLPFEFLPLQSLFSTISACISSFRPSFHLAGSHALPSSVQMSDSKASTPAPVATPATAAAAAAPSKPAVPRWVRAPMHSISVRLAPGEVLTPILHEIAVQAQAQVCAKRLERKEQTSDEF